MDTTELIIDFFLSGAPGLDTDEFVGMGQKPGELVGYGPGRRVGCGPGRRVGCGPGRRVAQSGDGFSAEGEVDTHDADLGEEMHTSHIINKLGSDYRRAGDEFNQSYAKATHHSLQEKVLQVFKDNLQPAELSKKFAEVIDQAVKDAGTDDHIKVLGAVLLSIRGLYSLGSGVRDAVLAYVRERHLNKELEHIQLRNKTHPDLD